MVLNNGFLLFYLILVCRLWFQISTLVNFWVYKKEIKLVAEITKFLLKTIIIRQLHNVFRLDCFYMFNKSRFRGTAPWRLLNDFLSKITLQFGNIWIVCIDVTDAPAGDKNARHFSYSLSNLLKSRTSDNLMHADMHVKMCWKIPDFRYIRMSVGHILGRL